MSSPKKNQHCHKINWVYKSKKYKIVLNSTKWVPGKYTCYKIHHQKNRTWFLCMILSLQHIYIWMTWKIWEVCFSEFEMNQYMWTLRCNNYSLQYILYVNIDFFMSSPAPYIQTKSSFYKWCPLPFILRTAGERVSWFCWTGS